VKPFSLLATTALVFGGLALTATAGDIHRADQAPGDADAVAAGKVSYAACGGCHGVEGEGKVGIAPRLNSSSYLAVVSNEFLKKTIVEGREGTNMIAWGTAFPEETVNNIVSYIRSWQTTPGVELDESELKGDKKTGEALYKDICSRCHGRSAAGYSEAGAGTGIGRKGFLGQASNGTLRAIVRLGKDNTAMRSFDEKSPVAVANLTDEEVDSIIQYLRANAW